MERQVISKEVVALFKDVKVFLTQASDIFHDFKAKEKNMKNIKYSDFQNPVLKRLLNGIINPLHYFSAEIKKLVVTSLLQAHSLLIVLSNYIL